MVDVEVANNPQVQNSDYSSYYSYITNNALFNQAVNTYSKTKDVHPLLSSTLNRVEESVVSVRDYATQKAFNGYNSYYVQPKESITSYYNSGAEKTKNAVVFGGTLGIGAAVVLTQFSLSLSAGGAGLVLDGVGAAQNAGQRALSSVKQAEQAVEHRIMSAIAQAQRIAMVPIDKVAESSNALLDILDTVVERGLSVEVKNDPDANIRQRVSNLASVIVQALSQKAHVSVIDPINTQLQSLLEQLSKSFILEWVLEKVEELSASVSDLKIQLENEAAQYKQRPEEVLMNSIRRTSSQLRDRLKALRQKGQSVFGDGSRVDGAIEYLEGLDKNLGDAENVYQVRDEVVSEARQRIAELTAWTSNFLVRQN